MARVAQRERSGGIGLGGVVVIVGLILAFTWSTAWGIIIVLIGLVVFGGFAKGKWY
jgi:ABC-type Mn2+/Zn2+ transport system permease subunit